MELYLTVVGLAIAARVGWALGNKITYGWNSIVSCLPYSLGKHFVIF